MSILKSLQLWETIRLFPEIWGVWFGCRRFGSRIDAPSGRNARRPQTCSARLALYFLLITVYRSFLRQQLTTACARFTQTIRAGLQPGCRVSLSSNFLRRSAASLQWRSHCRSAAWGARARRRLVPWGSPTWRQTARPCSRITYISPRFRAWCPRHSLARQVRVPPRNFAARHRQIMTCGAARASRHCAAKRSSTQSQWVLPNGARGFRICSTVGSSSFTPYFSSHIFSSNFFDLLSTYLSIFKAIYSGLLFGTFFFFSPNTLHITDRM